MRDLNHQVADSMVRGFEDKITAHLPPGSLQPHLDVVQQRPRELEQLQSVADVRVTASLTKLREQGHSPWRSPEFKRGARREELSQESIGPTKTCY